MRDGVVTDGEGDEGPEILECLEAERLGVPRCEREGYSLDDGSAGRAFCSRLLERLWFGDGFSAVKSSLLLWIK